MIRRADEIPFSWSVRRQEMWNSCRRSCFLHYYGASGGYDENASPELRRIHEMRSLLSESGYIRRLIGSELRRAFYAPHETEHPEFPDSSPPLAGAVLNRFRREFHRMLRGEFQSDHAAPMLESLYYPDPGGVGAVRGRLEQKLRHALEALESGVWPMLARIRFLHRRTISSPLEVTLPGALRCYTVPVLAFQEKREFSFIESSGADATALLLRFYAMNTLHIPPDRVRTFELLPEEGILRESGVGLNAARTLREIRAGAAEMLDVIRPSGEVCSDDFPPRREACPRCRFRAYCNAQ